MNRQPEPPPTPVIELDDVSLGYDGPPVIEHLDLTVCRGEVVGLLGPNGSGKSTLVRGILGLQPPLAGTLRLFGEPIETFRDKRRIGYVPQRQTVTGGIPSTVREVVSSGLLGPLRLRRPDRRAQRVATDAAIASVGLMDHADRPVASLSGGQQRRTLFARAIASRPEVLILDEPTAGVDRDNQRLLAAALADLVHDGTTILLITHELGPVESLVTRAIALRDGRIVHDGDPSTAPDEHHHDDDWHHDHADEPSTLGPGLGLVGP